MKYIYTLLNDHRWHLHIWDDRYSKGLWAMLAPTAILCDKISETTESEDVCDETTVAYLVKNEGSWLPIVYGSSDLNETLMLLDKKVEKLLSIEDFKYKVIDAYTEQ